MPSVQRWCSNAHEVSFAKSIRSHNKPAITLPDNFYRKGVASTMNSPADIWAKVLSLMEADMTATTINTWFDDARAISLDAD